MIATKTMQNKAINSQLKTEIKKANAAIAAGAADKEAVVRVAIKKIDQAAPRESSTRIPLPEESPPSPRSSTLAPKGLAFAALQWKNSAQGSRKRRFPEESPLRCFFAHFFSLTFSLELGIINCMKIS